MATGTVTLDKAYFETLLRRAQFHSGGVDYTTPLNVITVTIPKTDHDSLLATARQFANLQRNLFRGGIEEQTLAVLIKDDTASDTDGTTTYSAGGDPAESTGFMTQQPPISTVLGSHSNGHNFGRSGDFTTRGGYGAQHNGVNGNGNGKNGYNNGHNNGYHSHSPNDEFADVPDGFFDENGNEPQQRSQRPQFAKFAKRSIYLANLPEGTTHADITDVVRGGMLLDIFLRTNDRCANVSFLEEAAAQDFFQFVKRHDLYVKGKRVEIRWADRHFILPGHVANKVNIGATRNLVILNCSPKHTEEAIRDDLEHIHNLQVVKVIFRGQNAYISTNSVHNAMFARTCMMSRAKYKGSKIEWDEDECAAPIDRPQPVRKENTSSKKKSNAPVNRFHLLNLDENEDDSVEDDELDSFGEVGMDSGITLLDGVVPGRRYR